MSKLVEENNNLIYIDENQNRQKVQNAFKGHNGFHLCHGWYIYTNPIDITKDYEIQKIDDNNCKIIREI